MSANKKRQQAQPQQPQQPQPQIPKLNEVEEVQQEKATIWNVKDKKVEIERREDKDYMKEDNIKDVNASAITPRGLAAKSLTPPPSEPMGAFGQGFGADQLTAQPPMDNVVTNERLMTLVLDLMVPEKRDKALFELSKKRDYFPTIATVLWNSTGVMTILLQVRESANHF